MDLCPERKTCPGSDYGDPFLHLSGLGERKEAKLQLLNYSVISKVQAQLQQQWYLSAYSPN